jgi:hypothetical protein
MDPALKLKKIIESILEIGCQKENISKMFIFDKSLHDFLHRFFITARKGDEYKFHHIIKLFKSKREEITRAGCLVIKEGIDQGRFVDRPPEVINKYVGVMVEGLLHARYWEKAQFSPQQEADEMFEFLMEGIGHKPLQKGEER